MHPSGIAKSSTSFGWGKGGDVTSAGWQVTLCDPIWYASSYSGEACKVLAVYCVKKKKVTRMPIVEVAPTAF